MGGGLAGLSLAIQCARAGHRTILFEQQVYPFHKVCGEYISFESWNFLQDLGVPLTELQLPVIRQVEITAPNEPGLIHDLPLGGFGISRYTLDHLLARIAMKEGVELVEGCKVADVVYRNNSFVVFSNKMEIEASVVSGCYGKRSNLDIKWRRNFIRQKPNKLNHFIAVKYHITGEFPKGLISLHNFEGGYCGTSQIENDRHCLCYLTRGENLRRAGNDIRRMEKEILFENERIRRLFTTSRFLYEQPLAISHVSFNRKSQVEKHVLLIGDAAGLITPLCGNGMSMALHGSKLAFTQISGFLKGAQNRYEMEREYADSWEREFGRRLFTGRIIQGFFGRNTLSRMLIKGLRPFPRVLNSLIRQTHGDAF